MLKIYSSFIIQVKEDKYKIFLGITGVWTDGCELISKEIFIKIILIW